MNNILLAITTSSFYFLATLLLVLRLARTTDNQITSSTAQVSPAFVGIVLHCLLLSKLIFHSNGINLGFFNSLTLFAWLTTIVGIILMLRARLDFLGLVLFPISVLTIILALAIPSNEGHIHLLSPALQAHIMFSIFAYGVLSIAALLAITLALQDYQLQHRKLGQLLQALPPLESIENLLFKLIALGFGLLTLALISGFIFTDDWFNHKIIFSCIAWLVFLGLLIGRHQAGWRGTTAIRWTLGGIISLMLAFFGSKLVLEIIMG